jgi:CHAD domain-containing protein
MTGEMTQVERAIELDVDWDFEPPDLRPVVGRPQRLPEELQRTHYFDTPDLRLWARGLTLGYRDPAPSEAGAWVLSSPAPKSGRRSAGRVLTWPGQLELIPEPARRILRGVVRRSELETVAEYDTTRRRMELADGAAAPTWGQVEDDLITINGGPNDGLRFRRIELALKSGYPDTAGAVLEHLQDSGATVTERPRLAIGLGRPAGRPPGPSRGRSRHRPPTIGDTLETAIASALDRILDHDYRIRMDLDAADPEDVHQMRVATRRLRSDLKTFGSVLDPVWVGHASEDLRWVGTALGRVRDSDVMVDRLRRQLETARGENRGETTDALLPRLQRQRRSGTEELDAALGSDRYIDLLDRLHAAARGPLPAVGDTSALSAEVLPALVRKRWRALERRYHAGGRHPSDEQLHRMRIAAKRLRYAAEASVPAIGKPAKRTAVVAEGVQTALGELHDSAATTQWIERQLADAAITPADAFAAGLITREEDLQQARWRRRARAAWKQVKRKKNRAWLRK